MGGPSGRLEFWPDYGGVLLHEDGRSVSLDDVRLPEDLAGRARSWVDRYDDARLEPETRDAGWVAEGAALFHELREALKAVGIELVDWEGIWSNGRRH